MTPIKVSKKKMTLQKILTVLFPTQRKRNRKQFPRNAGVSLWRKGGKKIYINID